MPRLFFRKRYAKRVTTTRHVKRARRIYAIAIEYTLWVSLISVGGGINSLSGIVGSISVRGSGSKRDKRDEYYKALATGCKSICIRLLYDNGDSSILNFKFVAF